MLCDISFKQFEENWRHPKYPLYIVKLQHMLSKCATMSLSNRMWHITVFNNVLMLFLSVYNALDLVQVQLQFFYEGNVFNNC